MSDRPTLPLARRRVAIGITVVTASAMALLSLPTVAQDEDPAVAALAATTTDVATLPQTVPFRLVAGHIIVDAVVAGTDQPAALMVDSGAPTNLSDALVDAAGAEAAGQLTLTAIDGTDFEADVVPIPTLTLGDASFSDVGVIKGFLDPDNPLSCITADGIIGASLMKDAVWQIDFSEQEVTIAPTIDGLDHVDSSKGFGFTVDFTATPSPLISALAGDSVLTFLVDTGSDSGVSINPQDLAGVGIELADEAPAIDGLAAGAAGTYQTRLEYADVDLVIGWEKLDGFPVATDETLAAGQGNIGTAFLENYVVTFDWPDRQMYLDPLGDDPEPGAPLAAGFAWDGEGVVLGSVVEGSDLAEAGLTVGQAVTSVNGTDFSAATVSDYCPLLLDDTTESYDIELADGQTYTFGTVEDFYEPLGS